MLVILLISVLAQYKMLYFVTKQLKNKAAAMACRVMTQKSNWLLKMNITHEFPIPLLLTFFMLWINCFWGFVLKEKKLNKCQNLKKNVNSIKWIAYIINNYRQIKVCSAINLYGKLNQAGMGFYFCISCVPNRKVPMGKYKRMCSSA
jgi:hypothetical protein